MKNYSEPTDTKILVNIEFESIGNPEFTVNGIKQTDTNLAYYVDLLTPFSIVIELYNKHYTTEYETAVIIKRLSIDNIEIIPKYDYLAKYINDHNNNNPTSYLGFNGKWILTINRPFYQWLHQAQNQGWLIG
jgi:hypothetical protein